MTVPPSQGDAMDQVLQYRMQVVENAVLEIRASLKSIAESYSQLVVLEREHAHTRASLDRAFGSIKDTNSKLEAIRVAIPERLLERLAAIERDMPKHRMVAGWVLTGVLATVGAAGMLVWQKATEPTRRDYPSSGADRRAVPTEPVRH